MMQAFSIGIFVAALIAIAVMTRKSARGILGNRIPMQWGTGGTPNWFASRRVALWAQFWVTLVIGALIAADGYSKSDKTFDVSMALIVFSAVNVGVARWYLGKVAEWAKHQPD